VAGSTIAMSCGAATRLATGRRNYDPLEVGGRIEIGGQAGIVRTLEPILGELELRLVVQLLADLG